MCLNKGLMRCTESSDAHRTTASSAQKPRPSSSSFWNSFALGVQPRNARSVPPYFSYPRRNPTVAAVGGNWYFLVAVKSSLLVVPVARLKGEKCNVFAQGIRSGSCLVAIIWQSVVGFWAFVIGAETSGRGPWTVLIRLHATWLGVSSLETTQSPTRDESECNVGMMSCVG